MENGIYFSERAVYREFSLQDLLRETLTDELKVQKDLERIEKRLKLAPGDRYITPVILLSLSPS